MKNYKRDYRKLNHRVLPRNECIAFTTSGTSYYIADDWDEVQTGAGQFTSDARWPHPFPFVVNSKHAMQNERGGKIPTTIATISQSMIIVVVIVNIVVKKRIKILCRIVNAELRLTLDEMRSAGRENSGVFYTMRTLRGKLQHIAKRKYKNRVHTR